MVFKVFEPPCAPPASLAPSSKHASSMLPPCAVRMHSEQAKAFALTVLDPSVNRAFADADRDDRMTPPTAHGSKAPLSPAFLRLVTFPASPSGGVDVLAVAMSSSSPAWVPAPGHGTTSISSIFEWFSSTANAVVFPACCSSGSLGVLLPGSLVESSSSSLKYSPSWSDHGMHPTNACQG